MYIYIYTFGWIQALSVSVLTAWMLATQAALDVAAFYVILVEEKLRLASFDSVITSPSARALKERLFGN